MARDIHDDRYIRLRLNGNVTDYSAGRSPRQTQHQFFPCSLPPRGRGSQRDGHGGNSHCGPFPPSVSLDVNPVFARIFPLDKRDAYEKSLIPRGCLSNFAWPVTALFYPWTGFVEVFSSIKYIIAIRRDFVFSIKIILFREIHEFSWNGYFFFLEEQTQIIKM